MGDVVAANLPVFLVDEALIVSAHDRMIASDGDLSQHLAVINISLECLSRLPELHKEKNEEELAVLRLAVRCFNAGAASLRLLRCGYFQPAMTMVRDLVEITFLMDLFKKEPSSLPRWLYMPEKERKEKFKPVSVRQRLDQIDGYTAQRRRAAYDLLSQHAAHVNPNGHFLISPDNMTRIGPFAEYRYFKAGIEELATRLSHAALTFCGLLEPVGKEALEVKASFLSGLNSWTERYLRSDASAKT